MANDAAAGVPARLNYCELPVADAASSAQFYAAAFGWHFDHYGPAYAATSGSGTAGSALGLQGDPTETPAAPLPVIEVDDIEAALAAVLAAGGVLRRPIFAYPGGRRFHFTDPSGNELAVYVQTAASDAPA